MPILAVAAFLLFFHLGQRPLWQDEAETACLARNVLARGLPYAFDGTNVVSQEEAREFDRSDGCLWRWSPWIQIYLQAAGFAVGGQNATAARVPFAAAALLAVFWTYWLVRRHFGDRTWAILSAVLLVCCVPYLLIGRQARYYALGTLLVLWTLDAFLRDWRTRWGPWLAMSSHQDRQLDFVLSVLKRLATEFRVRECDLEEEPAATAGDEGGTRPRLSYL